MRSQTLISTLLTCSLAAVPIAAQTYTVCNPLTSGSCPADPALGRSVNIDFTDGPSDSFTPQGNPTYDSNGASFTVAKPGDSPQVTSKWYIMFGHVEFQVKPAPGVGIVSSAVLQSDDLDEIDWEWVGGDTNQAQSNYFSKGQTTTYKRGAFHPNPNNQAQFHTYTIDWTADQIAWQIDGRTVRTLTPEGAQGQYPQTPMMVKMGAWSGGDSANQPGTIAWAGGPTVYGNGPFSMEVKSVAVTDYSTGTQYSYSGTSGTWQSIQSQGGKINSGGGKAVAPADSGSSSSTSNVAPIPFTGTHRKEEDAVTTRANVYPWVATTLATSTTAPTTYPNLPSGYKTEPAVSPTSSPLVASGVSPGLETVTAYDQRGFPTVVVQAKGAVKNYNDQGFLITDGPALAARASPTASYSPGGDGTSVTAIAQMNKKVTTTSSSAVSWQGPGPLFPLYLVVGALAALMGTVALQVVRSIRRSNKCQDLAFWHWLYKNCSPSPSSPLAVTAEFRIGGTLFNATPPVSPAYGLHPFYQSSVKVLSEVFSERNGYTETTRHVIGQRIIFTANSDNIKAVLATQFNDYGKGEKFTRTWQDFLGHGIFTTDGEEWAASRQLLRPFFAQNRLRDLEVFEKYVQELLYLINGQGPKIDISELFYRFTLDAATDFLLGRSVGSLGNPDSQFAQAFGEVQRIQNMRQRAGPFQPLVPMTNFWKGLKVIDSFIEPFVQDALNNSPEELDEKEAKSMNGSTWLQSVARFTRDRQVIRDQIVNILLAGRDTTAGTLSFLFKELSAHPDTYGKLRREILEKVGSGQAPTYDDLKNMPYLQHCISETLRIYPSVPFNLRVALKDTSLPRGGGADGLSPVGVRKDTTIVYSTRHLQLNPSMYPAVSASSPPVLEFCPERWETWTPRPWQYLPFNGGPRICIGQQFALAEIGYTTVRIVQRFGRLEKYWGDGDDLVKSDIVLSPAHGVKVGFFSDAD
ncbi:MAG: hypothetical protein LQ339_000971 [Xanthoria mediterranea]|nr:MAG: hypothetical protein LQ339_000971 [Xanthoria mediterranea]